MATYYLDGTTLSNSTSVYDDSAQTTTASDGWYSDGVISRELVSGVLLPILTCPACDPPCGVTGAIVSPGDSALFKLNTGVGETASDVGAVKITFIPNLQGSGIRVTYDGNVYNELSSALDGYHASSTPGNYTIVGNTGASGCFALPIDFDYDKYVYSGGTFIDSGDTENVVLATGDASLSFSSTITTEFIMVIPKLAATPSTINIEVATPCSFTDWTIEIDCPLLLTGFDATPDVYSDEADAADGPETDATYYNMPIGTGSTPGEPQLYDFVYSDPYGENALADGYYGINTVAYSSPASMLVENGVITQIQIFTP